MKSHCESLDSSNNLDWLTVENASSISLVYSLIVHHLLSLLFLTLLSINLSIKFSFSLSSISCYLSFLPHFYTSQSHEVWYKHCSWNTKWYDIKLSKIHLNSFKSITRNKILFSSNQQWLTYVKTRTKL